MSCPQCCATGVHDTDSCERLFQEVIGHEFSRSELFGVHRLTVDAYSLQHPDRYMKSTKSAAAHLSGMCWSLEYGAGDSVSRSLSAWLSGPVELPRVEPPPSCERGRLTIRHVHDDAGSPEHPARVREWAGSVWEAWDVGHAQARAWVDAFVGARPGGQE